MSFLSIGEALVNREYTLKKIHEYSDSGNWDGAYLKITGKTSAHIHLDYFKNNGSKGHESFGFPSDGWGLEEINKDWDS